MEDNLLNAADPVVGTSNEQGLITIRLPFFPGNSQKLEDVNSGRTYQLTSERAHLLVSQLNSQLAVLEKRNSAT